MNEKNKNYLSDEEMENVSGGALMKSDKEWVDEQLWPFIENWGSWNDVVDSLFPDVLENYCKRVNSTPGRTASHITSPLKNWMTI